MRGRLWAALGLLSIAVLSASAVTWFALQRVDARLQALHQETLSQVAQALDLSKRSADLATSAPYLLNQRSNFLINQEGAKLIAVLDSVRTDWSQTQFGTTQAGNTPVPDILDSMSEGVADLVSASSRLDALQAELRAQTARLGALRNAATAEITSEDVDDEHRLIWWSLQSMNADALNAAYAGNLIGVGEERRHYLKLRQALSATELSSDQGMFRATLETVVWGPTGVFELRRHELSANLDAQNALFRIRHDANRINALASAYADQAEAFLADERTASSSTIKVTRISVAAISFVSLILALAAAIYVSRYVTFNISRVSGAMVRLANGDRTSVLPRKLGGKDEIGDLFRSFRGFRANALRLDRSNRQLDQRNALFEKVFTNISDGIAITDPSGRVTAHNPAFARILRLSTQTVDLDEFVSWLRVSRFAEATIRSNITMSHRGFCELVSDDGQVLDLRASKLPDDSRVWLVSDVTERRKMSDRLQQIDRIETLGKVAGDTAHDFANILSSIRTHAHLLKSHLNDEEKGSLEAIESSVDFGSSLTERLLAFARKQNLTPELVDINALVAGMTDLVEISLKPGVRLDVSLAEQPLSALVDPGQLESALFNLILNANNAIEDTGIITIRLEAGGSEQAIITIKDNGSGMSEEVLAHAIEPFFTTRSDAGGTGLGLSIVYGFIRQTGGNLDIDSTKGKGTRIEVTLPLNRMPRCETSLRSAKSAMVVEDDPKVRIAVTASLQQLGYEVSAHATGEAAIAVLESRAFDLLISDLDLGCEVDGLVVLGHSVRSSPSTTKIIMSGKSSGTFVRPRDTSFIQKPVTFEKLERTLKGTQDFQGISAD